MEDTVPWMRGPLGFGLHLIVQIVETREQLQLPLHAIQLMVLGLGQPKEIPLKPLQATDGVPITLVPPVGYQSETGTFLI